MDISSFISFHIITQCACLLFALQTSSFAAREKTTMPIIKFYVKIPDTTPTQDTIYISGNIDALGEWSAEGLHLEKTPDCRYYGKTNVTKGAEIEYKVTRGSWETVERGAAGEEIANRTLTVKSNMTVNIKVTSWASEDKSPRPSTLTGDIRYHRDFHSGHLGNKRTLIVYLPPGYEKNKKTRYPVLYMHDGQNIFDAATSFAGEWEADETAERLIRDGRIRPIIIVGIYNNSRRMDEYTVYRDSSRSGGGQGAKYAEFLVNEVKPFIDKSYRTKPGRKHTGVAGSSLGGLISLYICWKYPETFSMCGAVSPALSWSKSKLLKQIAARPGRIKDVRFWVDVGTREGDTPWVADTYVRTARELIECFNNTGLNPGESYYYLEVKGARHNEAAWAARFDKLLKFFFASR